MRSATRGPRDNIAAFGGDPGRVTVAGESAGAWCVNTLLAMPAAAELFRQAISQSGGAQYYLLPETGLLVARQLAGSLGIKPTREALAALPPEQTARSTSPGPAGSARGNLAAAPDGPATVPVR